MTIRRFVFALLFFAAPILAADKPPNIVFIFADDVGREVLGCYGGKSYDTPHLDALAESGMRFTHTYSMPVCHPSRVCLLTGRYPRTLGNTGWGKFPEQAENKTLASVLRDAGYATAVSGKWQLTLLKNDPQHPHDLGFDEYAVFGWHEGPRFHQPMIYKNGTVWEEAKSRYGPDVYCDFLIDFMEKKKEQPFFLWYSMALCHDVTDDIGEPPPFYKDGRWMNYKEMAESMDHEVGRLVQAIDDLGLRENTLIVYTTDNGTASSSYITVKDGKMVKEPVYSMLGDRKIRGGKGRLNDWGTRVPMIASWKGKIEAGQVVDDLIDFSDFLPTFAQIGNAELPADTELDGVSFTPRLLGTGEGPREWAYSESRGNIFWVRTRDYKLYNNGTLFQMANSGEEKPLDIAKLTDESRKAHELLQKAVDDVTP